MRIGVNCFNLEPAIGGIKQYFLMLFDELLLNDHDNEYVFLWSARNSEELANLRSDRWQEHAVLIESQREIRRHLAGLDVYFCPLSALYPRPVPLPSVVTLPDIQEVFLPEFFSAWNLFSRDRHFRGSTRMADCVITHSEFTKQTLVEHHRIPAEKVLVAYQAPQRIFLESESGRQPATDLPEDFVFFPANFWRHKNHDGLLRALRLLQNEHGLSINVVLTGYPVPNGYPVAEKAKEYGVEAMVHHIGYVRTEELVYLYRRARMLVFPSRYEGFGIPLVEAMVVGCPIAAANSTALPEIAGPAALLFDPTSPQAIADAIGRLWSDDRLRAGLVASGRQEAKRFSATRAAEAHLAAFGQASRSYAIRRYVWHRLGYGPGHAVWAGLRLLKRAGWEVGARLAGPRVCK
jgi:glycosyltransferase involved in cell wall biosynthesis